MTSGACMEPTTNQNAKSIAVRLANCSNIVRFNHRDTELADRLLALANEVWDLGDVPPPPPSHEQSMRES